LSNGWAQQKVINNNVLYERSAEYLHERVSLDVALPSSIFADCIGLDLKNDNCI
jgi:hypothetical protein